MQALIDGLERLNDYLMEKEGEKAKTEEEIAQCMARMDRAVRSYNQSAPSTKFSIIYESIIIIQLISKQDA